MIHLLVTFPLLSVYTIVTVLYDVYTTSDVTRYAEIVVKVEASAAATSGTGTGLA